MTAAHYQTVTLNTRLREWVPEHDPRSGDPLYKFFAKTKRLLKLHDVPCWRCGVTYETLVKKGDPATDANPLGAYQLEAHHSDVEFSLINAIDVQTWWEKSDDVSPGGFVQAYSNVDDWLKNHPQYQLQFSPNSTPAAKAEMEKKVFDAYMESEGNLMQLCDVCHRSKDQGIHHIPYPDWRVMAVWRRDLPAHVQ